MNEPCYYLDHYPLKEHYSACRDYLHNKIDWQKVSFEIKKNEYGVYYFDVSDTIDLFPHLELDENYQLICYVTSEYHGICGDVAALHKDCSSEPIIKPELVALSSLFGGMQYDLPETVAPPMEAIYNDGTPEGYFEALLCARFLHALPYTGFERKNWDVYMTAPPRDLDQWDIRVETADWRPRVYFYNGKPSTIVAFRRRIENGLGSSDGKDRVYLTEYNFQHDLGLCHMFVNEKTTHYKGQISDNDRYTDSHRCCVAGDSSILIAQEKHNTGIPRKLRYVLEDLYDVHPS